LIETVLALVGSDAAIEIAAKTPRTDETTPHFADMAFPPLPRPLVSISNSEAPISFYLPKTG
jgi:hypothetical protein